MGESLCSPSLQSTCLNTRSLALSVLERTLRQWYRRSACWYLVAQSEAWRRRSSPSTMSIPREASWRASSNAKTHVERLLDLVWENLFGSVDKEERGLAS